MDDVFLGIEKNILLKEGCGRGGEAEVNGMGWRRAKPATSFPGFQKSTE